MCVVSRSGQFNHPEVRVGTTWYAKLVARGLQLPGRKPESSYTKIIIFRPVRTRREKRLSASRPSVRPQVAVWLQLNGFSWNLTSRSLLRLCSNAPEMVKVEQHHAFYMNTWSTFTLLTAEGKCSSLTMVQCCVSTATKQFYIVGKTA
jgi:hypothetical protein